MPNHSISLFGKSTFEILPISQGTRYRLDWALDKHPGPVIHWRDLGRKSRDASYLYRRDLDLLYARFRQHNPLGVSIEINDMYENYAPQGLSEEQIDELYEQRKIFVNLIYTDDEKGYPHLRRYLPELFETDLLDRMEQDPWLDRNLLTEAVYKGHVPSRLEDTIAEDPRWTKEWRLYCDHVYGPSPI
jgi:hypothetical protein